MSSFSSNVGSNKFGHDLESSVWMRLIFFSGSQMRCSSGVTGTHFTDRTLGLMRAGWEYCFLLIGC